MSIDVTKLHPQSIAIPRVERCPHCGAILGVHQKSPFIIKTENDARFDIFDNDLLMGGYAFSYRCHKCQAVVHKTYAMSNTKLRKRYKKYKQYEGSSFDWDFGTTYYYSKQTKVKRKVKYDLALYEAIMEIPTVNGMDTYQFDKEYNCWFYDGLYTEGLPFENTRPRPKYAYRKRQIMALILVLAALYGIKNFTHHEIIYPANLNTIYTDKNKGGGWEHKYEFTLDEPGILTPEDDTLGGIASRDNVYIFNADDNKTIVHDKWANNSAESIYLEKGKYIALVTPGDAIDYSRKGYSIELKFEAQKAIKPGRMLQLGQVYKDRLSSADDTKTYQIKAAPNAKLIFQTNKPVGKYTGKISLIDNRSKRTLNEKNLFSVVVEDEDGQVISSTEVTSNSEISVSSDKDVTYTIKVSAIDFSPDTYTFYTSAE